MTIDKNKLAELILNSPSLKRVGAPEGNRNAKKNKNDTGKIKKGHHRKTSGGNSRKYWIGRLKRDAPQHLELLEKGEYKSIAEAARGAGFKKEESVTLERMFTDVEKLDLFELERVIYLAESRIKDIERKCTPHRIAKALHERLSRDDENILYALDYNLKSNQFYISQGTKLFNYSKKYADELKKSAKRVIKKELNDPDIKACNFDPLVLFYLYIRGEIDKDVYDKTMEEVGLPIIHRMIVTTFNNERFNNYFHPMKFKYEEYTDRKKNDNPKQFYLDTIQSILDSM